MKLIFKKLFLFSPAEKTAKEISFSDGINIITSNQTNGTDRGKSIILKSLYHTLGADVYFDDKWDEKNKVFILAFTIDDTLYYMYRVSDLFKFFNSKMQILFTTTSRHDLACQLFKYTNFNVQLPSRSNEKLEMTPPAYNYLLNFLDQDYYSITTFASFKNLAQYRDYKEFALYYHFGAFDQRFFELVRKKELLVDKEKETELRHGLIIEMVNNIDAKLEGKPISESMASLTTEIEIYKKEYQKTIQVLSKCKSEILALRSQEVEVKQALSELQCIRNKNIKDINILRTHRCPKCNSAITDVKYLISKGFVLSDDIILIKNGLEYTIDEITAEIKRKEEFYQSTLNVLKQYEAKMEINSAEINDILKYKGYCEMRSELILEKSGILDSIERIKKEKADILKQLKEYDDKKKAINSDYYNLLIEAKTKFGLNEIDPQSFKSIKQNFTAGGSNKPIATIIWYIALITLRNRFNPNAFDIPVVFDSPNNAETDDAKRHDLLQYILNSDLNSNQLILSSIGFRKDDFVCDGDINVVTLYNDKYHLLNEEDFVRNYPLLQRLCDAK